MDVEVAFSLEDQGDFEPEAAVWAGMTDAEGRLDHRHTGVGMGAADGEAHLGWIGDGGDVQGDARAILLAKCADGGATPVGCSGGWAVDHAEDGGSIDGEADHHGEFPVVFDEIGRAVDRIDHPDAPVFQAAAIVLGFLGKDRVVRESTTEAFDDELVGLPVGLGDELVTGLPVDLQGVVVKGEDRLPCLVGEGQGDV